MAKNPDPTLELATSKGVSRTLDDWSTMFQMCLVILPDRPEASAWVPVARRIFGVLGDSDCRTAYVVTGSAQIAKRILGDEELNQATFVDPDRTLVASLGLEHLPAFVFLRQDTTVGAATEGWDPAEWQRVAKEVARAMAWSVPEVAPPGEPIPTPSGGWKV
ncbi:MAG: hypothetical protein ACXVKA_16850 [Acidimicrobiia bacterium]